MTSIAVGAGSVRPDNGTPAIVVKDLVARYGEARAEGLLRWDGLLIAAPAGTDVRAVRGGKVVYAGWLPGMGQLVVLDHGGGLMSLYGHNQDVLKKTGSAVSRGDVIARVGDSGGQGSPGLYFEVHELLEPSWLRADGPTRAALQGLMQVAVGFQHLANGNLDGARALLREGAVKLRGRRVGGRDMDDFARAVLGCARELERLGAEAPRRFDWSAVPAFPAAA